MILRLRSGSSCPASLSRKRSLGFDVDERDAELLEGGDDLLGLVEPHQAVVDEDAGELLADRPVDEQRRDRGVDPAGEAADHPPLPHLGPDLRHLLFDHRLRRPLLLAAGDVAQEAGEDLGPIRGVDNLGVELDPVEPAVGVLAGGHWRTGTGRQRGEPLGRLEDRIAMAHPAVLLLRHPAEQLPATVAQGEVGPPELPRLGRLDLPAQRLDHRLHPVTDPQHRDPQIEQLGREGGRPLLIDGGGTAGEDQVPSEPSL